MKLAISNIAWNDNHDYYYKLMKDFGFSGLEIAPTKFSENPYDNLPIAREIKDYILNSYELPIISMQSLLFGTTDLDLFKTIQSRDRLQEYLKKAIVYAKTVSCPTLVFGNPKNRVMPNPNKDYATAVHFFYELGEFALKHNTCLCIEPNPKEYGTNFINTLEEANQLVNDVNSKGFGMIIDTSTMLINQNQPSKIINVLPNTKHIHISMPFLKPLNQEYDTHKKWLTDFFRIINDMDHNNYLSLEMANTNQQNIYSSLKILVTLLDTLNY